MTMSILPVSCRLLTVSLVLALVAPPAASAQTRAQGPWWPHPLWGPDDQIGASNWITPEKVLAAVSLVRTGRVFELGQVYDAAMPMYPGRAFSMTLKAANPEPYGTNQVLFNTEVLATEIGQVGTQFDGLGHVGARVTMADGTEKDVFYNGFTWEEIASPDGLTKLGVENVKPIVTRGILIDIAAVRGVPVLSAGTEVTVADVQAGLRRQGMTEADIQPGDAIFLRYGWATHWDEPSVSGTNPPGINVEVARWVVARQAVLLGSDSYSNELDPNPDPNLAYPVHQELVMRNGIHNLENLNLEELAASQVYRFLFVFTPLPIRGATGSPGRPIAIE